jgi:phospholipid transport system substrate-binding protein
MNMTKIRLLVALVALLAASGAAAQAPGPDELVRAVTTDVLDTIQSDKELQAGDRKKSLALAEQKVLPHIDFRHAAQLALGKGWSAATAAQQDQFVAEFRAMLVRIYASAIGVYRGQTMRVLPVNYAPGDAEVTVRNQYLKTGQPPLSVDYAMRRTAEGWKIYDIVVGGVSLVLIYRSEFDQEMRQSGVEGLIGRLAEKNR